MKLSSLLDIQLVDGDIVIINNETASCSGIEAMNQYVLLRMNTIIATSPLWPRLGNDIKHMAGKRNTKENAEILKAKLIECLSFGNVFNIVDTVVMRTDFDTLFFYVKVSFEDGVIFTLNFEFDFMNGMRYIV